MLSEDSFIDFKCPVCGEAAAFPQDQAGLIQSCPSCFESFIVPQPGGQAGLPIPIPIKTQRLTLRRFEPRDWKDLLEFMSDEELFRFMDAHPMDEEAVLNWLERDRHVRITTEGQPLPLGIELQEAGKLVGFVALSFIDAERRQGAITPWVSRPYQRQGIGTEACEGLLSFCFEGIGLHRVTAATDPRNTPAVRLFEKLGLRQEGEFAQDRHFKGEWVNTRHYAALRTEYLSAG